MTLFSGQGTPEGVPYTAEPRTSVFRMFSGL